jgi:voltage-gated potassium channel
MARRQPLMDLVIRRVDTLRELLFAYAALVVLAAAGFAYFEGKSFGDAIWWSVVTTTTTGYGDISPATLGGRIVASFVMLASILFVLPLLIGRIATTMIENTDAYTHDEQEAMKAELAAIRAELAKLSAAGSSEAQPRN